MAKELKYEYNIIPHVHTTWIKHLPRNFFLKKDDFQFHYGFNCLHDSGMAWGYGKKNKIMILNKRHIIKHIII